MGAVISAPLTMAGSCCGSLLGSCTATMCCKACSCACVASPKCTSIIYIIILMIFTLLALALRYSGGDIVIGGGYNASAESWIDHMAHSSTTGVAKHYWNSRFVCAAAHPDGFIICCANVCSGVFAVYRFSFVLCLFFATLLLCTIGNTRFGARVHRGFWFLKIFVLLMLLFSTIFVDNHAMAAYRDFARVASFFFLVMQILLLIDFGYRANEYLIELDERSEAEGWCTWKLAILSGAFFMYAASIAMWVLESNFFGKDGCASQQALIAITIIITISLSIVSCSRIAPHGTLLTSSIVTAYASYLCYSALASQPNPGPGEAGAHCNPFAERSDNSWSDLLVGFLVFSVSMASTAWSATGSKDKLMGKATPTNSELNEALDTSTVTSSSVEDAGANTSDSEEITGPESWWYYHLMMVVCSFYMAMLLTDWSMQPVDKPRGEFAVSLESFWVKIIAQWICLLMYAWTLLAPYLLRNHRDFGIEFDFD